MSSKLLTRWGIHQVEAESSHWYRWTARPAWIHQVSCLPTQSQEYHNCHSFALYVLPKPHNDLPQYTDELGISLCQPDKTKDIWYFSYKNCLYRCEGLLPELNIIKKCHTTVWLWNKTRQNSKKLIVINKKKFYWMITKYTTADF